MTFVGKILVIVIMVFAVLFLGFSAVVFTTATTWKDVLTKEKTKHQDTQKKLTDAQAEKTKYENDLKAAKTEHATASKALEQQIEGLQKDVKDNTDQATAAKDALGKAEQNSKIALEEAKARKEETDQLREQKSGVEKQANEFKLRQTELNDKISELTRMNETLKNNNKDLKERTAKLSTALRAHGLSDDVSRYEGLESPPAVEGEVTKVDKFNKTFELSIGSDDGLQPGHELFLFRTKPHAQYLGKIKVMSVDPDQSVAKIIGTTVQGKKVQEGDSVSSTINPRS